MMERIATTVELTRALRRRRSLVELANRHRLLVLAIVLALLPWVLPYQALATNVLIFGLLAVGYNLVYGYTGMLSFGHGALFGSGAYGCGIAIAVFGLSWPVAMLIGVLLAVLLAAVMGALAIRSRGIYFAMVTLALAQCVYFIFYQAKSLTGGEDGRRGVVVDTVHILGFEFNLLDPVTKYYFFYVFVAAALYLFSRILASPFGAALEAIRENENRARACGFDTTRTKLIAFVLSAVFCGLAGTLNAIHLSVVPTELLSYQTSGMIVMMVLLGGAGTFVGPFVGAAFFLIVEDVATAFTSHWQLVVGCVFIACVLFFPQGLVGTINKWMKQ